MICPILKKILDNVTWVIAQDELPGVLFSHDKATDCQGDSSGCYGSLGIDSSLCDEALRL
jgi:hypothetical protein